MKITPNKTYDAKCSINNISVEHPCIKTNDMPNDSVSFGSLKSGISNGVNKVVGNFFAEFLIVDALSLMLPRTIIGLFRDRDKTGKINYKAGAEEAGREVISGPSMSLIPMATVWLVTRSSPASHLDSNAMKGMTHNMQKAVNGIKDPSAFRSQDKMDRALANQLFDDAFSEFDLNNRESLKSKFSDLLLESKKVKPAVMFNSKAYKTKLNEFEEHVSLIMNQNKKCAPTDTKALSLSMADVEKGMPKNKVGITSTDLFADFHNYSKDVVHKFTNQGFTKSAIDTCKKEAKPFLEHIQKICGRIKLTTVLTGFFAVGSFLLYLPRLYQQGKISPAMESAKRAQAEAFQGGANENK